MKKMEIKKTYEWINDWVNEWNREGGRLWEYGKIWKGKKEKD